jgi:thiol-disulfide isomerase/thioredoxin
MNLQLMQLNGTNRRGSKTMSAITKKVRGAVMLGFLGASIAMAQSANEAKAVNGRWDASLTSFGQVIPFRLDITGSGPTLRGILYDGSRPNDGTSSASFENNKLVLRLDQYETIITSTLNDGKLTGNLVLTGALFAKAPAADHTGSDAERLRNIEFAGNPNGQSAFQAVRHIDTPEAVPTDVPQIGGSWIIPLSSPSAKGENAFRLIVEQKGTYVEASILRVDGDTGAYSGTYKDGKWLLSHYDGGRPGVIQISAAKDGSLEIIQWDGITRNKHRAPHSDASAASSDVAGVQASGRYADKLIAYRPEVERTKGLPEPDNYQTHTGVRNPDEVFKFAFPDDNGKLVSNDDIRFKNKVVIAMITGTWCPNCHDEAQYLVQLYKKYHDKGLEIVALDFEEPSQQKSLSREKAFVKHYGVQYPYLIAGDVHEVWEKIPQFSNLNSWPTIIFIGRDGKVKATHTGFASPASGEFYTQLKSEFESNVEKLLAGKPVDDLAGASSTPAPSGL